MSVERVKREVSPRELVRWERFFEQEANAFHRGDHFLARIAYEVYLLRLSTQAAWGGKPPGPYLSLKDFMVKFERKLPPSAEEAEAVVEEIEVRRKQRMSKLTWGMAVGADWLRDEDEDQEE